MVWLSAQKMPNLRFGVLASRRGGEQLLLIDRDERPDLLQSHVAITNPD